MSTAPPSIDPSSPGPVDKGDQSAVSNTTTGQPDNTATSDTTSSQSDTPVGYIPGLYILGSTYDVLNGNYADSKSALQQVLDWTKIESRVQQYGGKTYNIPDLVNYDIDTKSFYQSSFGKSTLDYSHSLSIHAGFEASFPGFSSSASSDYSESQRENLAHAFTRVTYINTEYDLSLPPVSAIKTYFKPWFVNDLENQEPIAFYKAYGTHFLRSITIGGRATFLTSTDTLKYHCDTSIEVAAHLSAQYGVASGSVDFSTTQRKAMDTFHEASETSVMTKGGDPRYGNDQFLKNSAKWAASVAEYPEFIDFGSSPCFIALSELASTDARRDSLRKGFDEYVKQFAKESKLPGPYLKARTTDDFDSSLVASMDSVGGGTVSLEFPTSRTNDWYVVSPGLTSTGSGSSQIPAIIVSEITPGALAPVTWEPAFAAKHGHREVTCFWRAIPPTSEYLVLGSVATMTNVPGLVEFLVEKADKQILSSLFQTKAPAKVTDRFRAVHNSALTLLTKSISPVYPSSVESKDIVFCYDQRHVFADTALPSRADCYILDPAYIDQDSGPIYLS